jgi:hypothetical protein
MAKRNSAQNSPNTDAAAPLPAEWDPLTEGEGDLDILAKATKREIQNIIKSYTGYYDLFAELLQNALDAVEKRMKASTKPYRPLILVKIDLTDDTVTVIDNGCGMNSSEFKTFLRPNFSFKDGVSSRGSKGVGATYLAYGFNHLVVATKQHKAACLTGAMQNGRRWLDDTAQIINRPKVRPTTEVDPAFDKVDCGSLMTVRLVGDHIRPKNLAYYGATTATQWMAILRVHTAVGGIYLCGEEAPHIRVRLEVTANSDDEPTVADLETPQYLYPHLVLGKTVDLREFLKDQKRRADKQLDLAKIPPKFTNQNGIWGEWTGAQILDNESPIKPRLDESERAALDQLDLTLYVFMGFSTDLWDDYNDKILELRKGSRLLRGGLQQATKHMPQGHTITIPLTESIGYQTLTHIVAHFARAEPDLGRKGFQPEHTRLAERVSTSAVATFKKYFGTLLRRKTGAPGLLRQMQLSQWIDQQRDHEKQSPLVIRGKGLFAPTETLPIRSEPLREQDVVALFNEMLSAGLVRGIQLLSSSQYNQYDGLYRVRMEPPFERYIRSEENPLGVNADIFVGVEKPFESPVRVLEYKFNMDALIEEFATCEKNPEDIALAVAWEIGEKWKESFTVLSYLDDENVHHRQVHGLTHSFSHAVSGTHAFEAIILKDLVSYCVEPAEESARQKKLYSSYED